MDVESLPVSLATKKFRAIAFSKPLVDRFLRRSTKNQDSQ